MDQDSTKFLLLKIFVYAMALVLVGGAIYIGAEITERMQKKGQKQVQEVVSDMVGVTSPMIDCKGGNLNITGGVDSIKMQGGNLAIISRNKNKITIVDYCNGKVISEIGL